MHGLPLGVYRAAARLKKHVLTLQFTGLENSNTSGLLWGRRLLVIACCLLLSGCRSGQSSIRPSIEFTRIPLVDEGGTGKIAAIEGRVTSARPGQQIVLYARGGAWYVQPFTDQPFTTIQPDSTWKSSTHLGTEYAALLVEPGYHPPLKTELLPAEGDGVAALATVRGEAKLLAPMFWRTWWFRFASGLLCVVTLLAAYRFRVRQLTTRMNVRFEERLAERMRIAQDLHDTLLQDFLGASMQLYVAVERLPEDSPAQPHLRQVRQLMERAIEQGRNTVRGLRSITMDSLNLEQAFARIKQELAIERQVEFQVTTLGQPRLLHPIIRDEVYRIGREILVNGFRFAATKRIELEVKYSRRHLRITIRVEGDGFECDICARLRAQAESIGARLKVRSRAARGTEIELSVPGRVAFLNQAAASATGREKDE